jgi:predicted nucleotidyltransferase
MTEELEVLKTVTRRLSAAGIEYMVTGSMAVNYYAVPRMTRDIDLVVALSEGDADRIEALFGEAFYLDRQAVRSAIEQRASFKIIETERVVKVDFVVRKESEYRRTELTRRRRITIDGAEVFVVAPEDLVLSKLDWARESRSEVQLADVRNVLAAVPDIDRGYLALWAQRLGLEALLAEVTR